MQIERGTREPDPQSRDLGKGKETTVLSPEPALPLCSKAHTVPSKTCAWGLHPLEVVQMRVNRDLTPLKPTLHVFVLKPEELPT